MHDCGYLVGQEKSLPVHSGHAGKKAESRKVGFVCTMRCEGPHFVV